MRYLKYTTILLVAVYCITSKSKSEDHIVYATGTYQTSNQKYFSIMSDKIKMSEIKSKIYTNKQLISSLNRTDKNKVYSLISENQNLYNQYFKLQDSVLERYSSP